MRTSISCGVFLRVNVAKASRACYVELCDLLVGICGIVVENLLLITVFAQSVEMVSEPILVRSVWIRP